MNTIPKLSKMIEIYILQTEIDNKTFFLSSKRGDLSLSNNIADADYKLIRLSASNLAKKAFSKLGYKFKVVEANLINYRVTVNEKPAAMRYNNKSNNYE